MGDPENQKSENPFPFSLFFVGL